jgi:hypothetical protein
MEDTSEEHGVFLLLSYLYYGLPFIYLSFELQYMN